MLLPVLDPIPVDLGVISREPVGPIVPTLPTYKGWTPADERFAVALDRPDHRHDGRPTGGRHRCPAGREPKRVRWPLNGEVTGTKLEVLAADGPARGLV